MLPPRTILAPVDFSEPSRTALATAARLALHTGAALHVVFAQHPLLAEAARHEHIDLAADTTTELDRFIAATPPAASVAPGRHVATGSPVDVIVAAVRELKADLIVVGSHGMSGTARLVFGSTTEGVLRRAPVSILVTPAAWSAAACTANDLLDTGPIIAAIDFSQESIAAANAACGLAAALGTTVTLLHVVAAMAVPGRYQPHAGALLRNRETEARSQLESLRQTLPSSVHVTTIVETGDVPAALAAAAGPSTGGRPMLVLGRKPPGQRDGAPGAIAYRVLMLSQSPVLVHVAG
jgi:nucleotide-binding universal stress UspA family protein